MTKACRGCVVEADELRGGWCWDCANGGERKLANRSVVQHLLNGAYHVATWRWFYASVDFTYAWQRLTRTGDYKSGGYLERQGHFRA